VKRLQKFFWKWGFYGIYMYLSYKFSRRRNATMSIPGYEAEVTVRPGTSDMQVFDSIFIEEQYSVDLLSEDFKPGLIIDAGANIGLSTIYLASRFPEAEIIAIEPEPSNFELLQQNVRRFPKITCQNKALWADNSLLELENPNDRKFSFQVRKAHETNVSAVQGINVADLLSQYNRSDIGIMKIDIEGAEKELFSADTSWLNRTEVIFIELHERKKTGCVKAFYDAVAPHLKQEAVRGDTLLIITHRHEHGLSADEDLIGAHRQLEKESVFDLLPSRAFPVLIFMGLLLTKLFIYDHDETAASWHLFWEICCVTVSSFGILCRFYAAAVFSGLNGIHDAKGLTKMLSETRPAFSPCHDLNDLGNFLIGLGIAAMPEIRLIAAVYVTGFIVSNINIRRMRAGHAGTASGRLERTLNCQSGEKLWKTALQANSLLIPAVFSAFLFLEHSGDLAEYGKLNFHPFWTMFLIAGFTLSAALKLYIFKQNQSDRRAV